MSLPKQTNKQTKKKEMVEEEKFKKLDTPYRYNQQRQTEREIETEFILSEIRRKRQNSGKTDRHKKY